MAGVRVDIQQDTPLWGGVNTREADEKGILGREWGRERRFGFK